jgi:outer membrane protein TolC
MKTHSAGSLVLALLVTMAARAQQAPPSPDKPFAVSRGQEVRIDEGRISEARPVVEDSHPYTLPELVDIGERNNPATRLAWEQAKQKAAAVGIARSALFPTVAALASASYNQYSLFVTRFYHEDLATFPATLSVNYTVFDFGAREAKIDQARANLLAADLTFNDTHRRVVFEVVEAYYRLLDAMSQEESAQATLTDAQTVQQAIEAKLANGFATLPDVLEARAATAQVRYELASIRGLEDIAHGVLANVLGVAPSVPFRVEDVSKAPVPETVEQSVQTIIARALTQRPDLLAEVASLRSADAVIREAHAAYSPTFSFSGDWGHRNSYGSENFNLFIPSHIYPYSAQLNLSWTIFDGGSRRNHLARAEAQRGEARARVAVSRNQIENEIWTAYSKLKTTQEQREAADALLQAAEQSYTAATRSFQAGVRTFVDVTTAQRDLARARTAEAATRIEVLIALADLAFRAADPISAAQH